MPSAAHMGADADMNHGIRDVWRHNLEEEFILIRKIVNKYCYVAMDTEFPGNYFHPNTIISLFNLVHFKGVVARPIGEFRSTADYQYQLLRCNVDLLKIIQLGLTFMDEQGNTAPEFSTWQFNFKFSLT
jgi:CCR4-NOT transcription complex subunit 7/8